MKNAKVFISCLLVAVVSPYAIVKVIPENIAEARLVENAPRHKITVSSKWTQDINPYWIRFPEPVAKTGEMQLTSAEWKSVAIGEQLTIAVLPDGSPHSLDFKASVVFEQAVLVFAIVLWCWTTVYVIVVTRRWVRRRRGDLAAG
jgi:hypothetical protein